MNTTYAPANGQTTSYAAAVRQYPAADVAATPAAPTRPAAAIDQMRYGAGAALTAGIAVLAAVVAMIVTRGILNLNVLAADSTLLYALGAAGIALGAAALYDAMLHVAPRPTAYFGTLCALGIGIAVAIPFTSGAPLADQTGLALMNLAVGTITALLIPLAASNARH